MSRGKREFEKMRAWENSAVTQAHKSLVKMNENMRKSTDEKSTFLDLEDRKYENRDIRLVRIPRKYLGMKLNPDGTISEK